MTGKRVVKKINLAALDYSTKQEVFDYVTNHLLTQNKKSTNGAYCAYRGKNGCKCAAGCLIDDNEYISQIEGFSWFRAIEILKCSSSHSELIMELQNIHDTFLPQEWENQLKSFASEFNLKWNYVKK